MTAQPASSPRPVDEVVARVKATYGRWVRGTTVQQMRSDWEQLFPADGLDASLETADADGVPCLWVRAAGVTDEKTILYFHGGGFQVGSPLSHAELMANLSQAAGCRVLGVDYRMAPEHALPAAHADARTAYEWLLKLGASAGDIALAGDSAGGNLVLQLALALRDDGAKLPAGIVLMSPWTDMSASGESYETRAAADPIHQRAMIHALARNCLGKAIAPASPQASPLFASMQGLPPMLIQVGDTEVLLSDATVLADKARAAGVPVELEVWEHMIHVFQQFPRELAEARDAIARIGSFLRSRLTIV